MVKNEFLVWDMELRALYREQWIAGETATQLLTLSQMAGPYINRQTTRQLTMRPVVITAYKIIIYIRLNELYFGNITNSKLKLFTDIFSQLYI